MFGQSAPFITRAALAVSAFLLSTSALTAGEHVHARVRPATQTPAAAVVFAPPATSFVVVVTTPVEPYTVTLRGSDGGVRRFPVEGGPAAIEYRSAPVVLRPGQSVTLRWVAKQ